MGVFGVFLNAVQLRSFSLRKLVSREITKKKSYLFWISICADLFCLKRLRADFAVFRWLANAWETHCALGLMREYLHIIFVTNSILDGAAYFLVSYMVIFLLVLLLVCSEVLFFFLVKFVVVTCPPPSCRSLIWM